MSYSDEELEKMIDKLDSGDREGVSSELQQEYDLMVKGVGVMGETHMREQLMDIHEAMEGRNFKHSKVYWISGMAMTALVAFFWWQSMSPKLTSPELKMNEIPAYGDSATYDSLKNIEPTVDKEE